MRPRRALTSRASSGRRRVGGAGWKCAVSQSPFCLRWRLRSRRRMRATTTISVVLTSPPSPTGIVRVESPPQILTNICRRYRRPISFRRQGARAFDGALFAWAHRSMRAQQTARATPPGRTRYCCPLARSSFPRRPVTWTSTSYRGASISSFPSFLSSRYLCLLHLRLPPPPPSHFRRGGYCRCYPPVVVGTATLPLKGSAARMSRCPGFELVRGEDP